MEKSCGQGPLRKGSAAGMSAGSQDDSRMHEAGVWETCGLTDRTREVRRSQLEVWE